jgi:putative oxidoreductase
MSTSVTPSVRSQAGIEGSALLKISELAGRILLAVIFLLSGLTKIAGYTATAGYMSSMGVPSALLPLVIATEVLGSIAVIVGWKTRIAAFLLGGFSVLAGALFHNNFADQIQMIMFMKDVAIAGGFALLVAHGAGPLSIDARHSK